MQNYRTRKSNRLKEYDYTQPGYYFVTVCVQNHNTLFGEMVNNQMKLNDIGIMISNVLINWPDYYPDIEIDTHVVMPNHIHAIIKKTNPVGAALRGRPLINNDKNNEMISDKTIDNDRGPAQRPAPTGKMSLSDIIYGFKSITTTRYIDGVRHYNWPKYDKHLWQRSFHDHSIRSDRSLHAIREYIMHNPENGEADSENLITTR